MSTRNLRLLVFVIRMTLIALLIWWHVRPTGSAREPHFQGQRAYGDVISQVSLGPRTPGSQAHVDEVRWLQSVLSLRVGG